MRLLVGIPTRNRQQHLENCLYSLYEQTNRKFDVVIINDNDDENPVEIPDYLRMEMNIGTITGDKKGPPFAHQKVLNLAKKHNYEFVFRVDDDVTLDANCINTILPLFDNDSVGAVGPIVWWGTKTYGKIIDNYQTSRLQWYGHKDQRLKIAAHLGTTFCYRVSAAVECGEWPLNYSRAAYREEADFTMRLRHVAHKLCLVHPGAFSRHWIAPAGGIERSSFQYKEQENSDKKIFLENMAKAGIKNPEDELHNNFLGFFEDVK